MNCNNMMFEVILLAPSFYLFCLLFTKLIFELLRLLGVRAASGREKKPPYISEVLFDSIVDSIIASGFGFLIGFFISKIVSLLGFENYAITDPCYSINIGITIACVPLVLRLIFELLARMTNWENGVIFFFPTFVTTLLCIVAASIFSLPMIDFAGILICSVADVGLVISFLIFCYFAN